MKKEERIDKLLIIIKEVFSFSYTSSLFIVIFFLNSKQAFKKFNKNF